MAPERMAIWNGSFFFFMGDHYNYPDNPEMHYSLFCSLSGTLALITLGYFVFHMTLAAWLFRKKEF